MIVESLPEDYDGWNFQMRRLKFLGLPVWLYFTLAQF